MTESQSDELLVAIVDDERDLRMTLVRGLEKYRIKCHPLAGGKDFLEAISYLEPDCVLLDLNMPGMTGMDVLSQIPAEKSHIPVIIFTSHGDVPTVVKAMRSGAVEFLEKPMSFQQISEHIRATVARSSPRVGRSQQGREAKRLLATLTEREAKIVHLVCQGLRNADIAKELDNSVRTVEVHRYHATRKLGTSSVAELILLVQAAENPPA